MEGSREEDFLESGRRVPKKNNPARWEYPPLCSKRNSHPTKDHQRWKNTAHQRQGVGDSTALLCAGTNASIALAPGEGMAHRACLQLLLSPGSGDTSDQQHLPGTLLQAHPVSSEHRGMEMGSLRW